MVGMSANRIGLRRRAVVKAPSQRVTFCDSSTPCRFDATFDMQLTPGELLSVPYSSEESVAAVAVRICSALNERGIAASTRGSTVTVPQRHVRSRIVSKGSKHGR